MIQTIKQQHVLGKIGASNLCVLAENKHVMIHDGNILQELQAGNLQHHENQ